MNANHYGENEAGRETMAVGAGAQGGPSVELTSELRPAGTLGRDLSPPSLSLQYQNKSSTQRRCSVTFTT